jgi:hypothetical protein
MKVVGVIEFWRLAGLGSGGEVERKAEPPEPRAYAQRRCPNII